MAGRTISITHRGWTAIVKEGHDNTCVIDYGEGQVTETSKKFPAAAREALSVMLKEAGEMRGKYER